MRDPNRAHRVYGRRGFLREGLTLAGAVTLAGGAGCSQLPGRRDAEEREDAFVRYSAA